MYENAPIVFNGIKGKVLLCENDIGITLVKEDDSYLFCMVCHGSPNYPASGPDKFDSDIMFAYVEWCIINGKEITTSYMNRMMKAIGPSGKYGNKLESSPGVSFETSCAFR